MPKGQTFVSNRIAQRTRITTMVLGLLVFVFLSANIAEAATFNIANGDVAGLIAAIQTANASGGPNTINLAAHGTYTLTAVAQDDGYWGPTGLPYIVGPPLTINGNGATIQRSSAAGTPNFRILFVSGLTVTALGNLTLDGVTIAGGNNTAVPASIPNGSAGGGLLANYSTVLLRGSTVTQNFSAYGGGIYNFCSTLTIVNSTISYNTGYSSYGGGGILDFSQFCQNAPYNSATAFISFSTIFENQANGAAGFQGRGDAIADAFSAPGAITVKNSILASPTQGLGSACYATPLISSGHNIAGDNSCGLTGAGDMSNTNPLLGPTADNGGPTPTDLPLLHSPAIDAVPLAFCTDALGAAVLTDQRGFPRPQGVACDIGSVDVAGDSTPPTIVPQVTGTLGNNGWYRSNVTVSWNVTDPESGIVSSSGCSTTTLTTDTAGVTLTCSATDGANLTASNSVMVKIDQTPPTANASATPLPNGNGWNNGPVTVTFSGVDNLSGVASCTSYPAFNSETSGMTVSGSCTDLAGNISNNVSASFRLDRTPPLIVGSLTPGPNQAGWNNTPVNVSFVCTDALSGVSVQPSGVVVGTEGANQSVGGSCTDNAGNLVAAVVGGINIDKTPPSTTNVVATPNPVAINAAVALGASLSDTGGSNLSVAEYSVNGSTPANLTSASGATAQVSAPIPPFAATGVYSICVRARDVSGNIGDSECLFLPVYDPSGGFVTGGGWIDSPAGAYNADTSLTGKATFGFESRYQHGANVPTGDTQFQFKVANLNFKSTSYDWLVIAGARAQYQGSGTINGTGTYNFLLTAIDGDVQGGGGTDRFRIKIWNAGGTVYDNQMGANDNDNPTTALGGGNIVIHQD